MKAHLTAEMRSLWIRIGVASGLAVSARYPLMVFAPLPFAAVVGMVAAFGPLLGIASYGLLLVVELHHASIAARMATVPNVIAGVLFTKMLLVQLAIRSSRPDDPGAGLEWVWPR